MCQLVLGPRLLICVSCDLWLRPGPLVSFRMLRASLVGSVFQAGSGLRGSDPAPPGGVVGEPSCRDKIATSKYSFLYFARSSAKTH